MWECFQLTWREPDTHTDKMLVNIRIQHKQNAQPVDFTGRMLHLSNEGMNKYCSNSEKGWIQEAWNDQVKTIQTRLSLSFVLNCAQDVHPLVTVLCMGEEALANEWELVTSWRTVVVRQRQRETCELGRHKYSHLEDNEIKLRKVRIKKKKKPVQGLKANHCQALIENSTCLAPRFIFFPLFYITILPPHCKSKTWALNNWKWNGSYTMWDIRSKGLRNKVWKHKALRNI